MDTYSFQGQYALKDKKTNRIVVQTNFEGVLLRDSKGNILGDLDFGDNGHRYNLRGTLAPRTTFLLLSSIAVKEDAEVTREPPLELQFLKHGCLTDMVGSYGGGIKIASEEAIARLSAGKEPLQKGLRIWATNRNQRNASLQLFYS